MPGKPFPNLIKLNKYFLPTSEARQYVTSPERSSRAMAEEHIVKSLPQKLIGNFYIRFDTPLAPTKLFTDEKKVLNWLKRFLNI